MACNLGSKTDRATGRLSRGVDASTMLGAVNQNNPCPETDFVDDSKIASPRRKQARELSTQRLSRPPRIRSDTSENRFDHRMPNLFRELVEMSKRFRR